MTTYGRKRRGLLSPFSVFQDPPEPRTKPSGYSRLLPRSASRISFRSKSRQSSPACDDDSLCELASVATEPRRRQGRQSLDLPPIPSLITRREDQSFDSKFTARSKDKPLPPIPLPLSTTMPRQDRPSKQALTEQPTNLQLGKGLARTKFYGRSTDKLKISAPLPHSGARPATSKSLDAPNPRMAALPHTPPLPYSVSMITLAKHTQPAQGKESAYFAQDNASSSQTDSRRYSTRSTDRKIKGLSRTGEPRKGRQMLGMFKDAITERLPGSFVNRYRAATFATLSEESPSVPLTGKAYQSDLEARAKRRMAEEKNFSISPKVRDLTGSPGKPLLSRRHGRSSSDGSIHTSISENNVGLNISGIMLEPSTGDPFTEPAFRPASSPHSQLENFEFNFAKKMKSHSAQLQKELQTTPKDNAKIAKGALTANKEPALRFSDQISGLRQHPDVLEFAERPVGDSLKGPKSSNRPSTPPGGTPRKIKRQGLQLRRSPPASEVPSNVERDVSTSFADFIANEQVPIFDDNDVPMDLSMCPTITVKRPSEHSKRSSAEAGFSPARIPKKSKRVDAEDFVKVDMQPLSPDTETANAALVSTSTVTRSKSSTRDNTATAKVNEVSGTADPRMLHPSDGNVVHRNDEEDASWLLTGSSSSSFWRPKTHKRTGMPHASGSRSAAGKRGNAGSAKVADEYGSRGCATRDELGSADELGLDGVGYTVGWAR